jgi:hypothetical protein
MKERRYAPHQEIPGNVCLEKREIEVSRNNMNTTNLSQDLIGDLSLGVLRYPMRRCERIVSRLQISLTKLFAAERNPGATHAY